MGKILLYYKYIFIENPENIQDWQRELCQNLNLKGRVIIAKEGINGTLGGSEDSIKEYKKLMANHPLFSNIDFKESFGDSDHFPRLRIVIKNEIVHLGLDIERYNAQNGGQHLSPKEAHKLITSKKNLVLLDTRNDYESKIGTFQNAVIPNTKTFREFPQYIDKNLDKFKDKEVLMFCTGGVRCERASAYLKSKGICKEIYQIKGGIHRYVEEFPNGHFKGKNYVFDGRISTQVTQDILAECEHCKIPYDDYTNCINAECNRQIVVCQSCITEYHNTCSKSCLELVKDYKVNIRKIPKKANSQQIDKNV